jgi:DnaK suppressor protein
VAKTEKLQAPQGVSLETQKQRLLEQRQQITDQYQQDLRAGKEAADEGADDIVDRANNSYNREFMFSLSDTERETLRLVEKALLRLETGEYGNCRNCGQEIGAARLTAVPWARFCIDCQELAEQGLLEEHEDS